MLTKDGIRILAVVVVATQCKRIYFPNLTPLKDLMLTMCFKSHNEAIVTDTPLINSSP
jgi:hypothetical protein